MESGVVVLGSSNTDMNVVDVVVELERSRHRVTGIQRRATSCLKQSLRQLDQTHNTRLILEETVTVVAFQRANALTCVHQHLTAKLLECCWVPSEPNEVRKVMLSTFEALLPDSICRLVAQ
jgi:hypothetical protein